MNQPNQQPAYPAVQNPPGAGYPPQGWAAYPQQAQPQFPVQPPQQTAYQTYPPYQAYQAVRFQAPGFAIKQKDPRKTGALSTLNKLGLLMVAQTALSFLLQLGVVIACMSVGINIYDVNDDNLALVMISIGLTPLCTGLPPLIYMLVGKKDWNFHLRFGRANILGCLLVVTGGLGVCMAANIPAAAVTQLLEKLGATEPGTVLGQGGGWVSFTAQFLGIAVMVPILEEFAFRGVILSGLRRYGAGFAIAASSLIFGMAHMSISTVVFAAIAGAAMGTAYVLTGNLWVSVAIHALNNSIAIIESYSDLLLGEGYQELLAGIIMLAVCAAGIVSLVLLLVLRRRLFPKREPLVPADGELYAPLGFGESAVTMLKSPVLWAILAMVLVETGMMFL